MFVQNGDVVYTTRKSRMNRIYSTYRTLLNQQKTLGLVILVILGLVGGISLVVQQVGTLSEGQVTRFIVGPSSYATLGCSLYNASSATSASILGAVNDATTRALAQVNQIPNNNKFVLKQKICASSMSARTDRTSHDKSGSYSRSAVAAIIYRVFGPYSSGAMNVAMCESGLNPRASNPYSFNGSHAAGVFQILYPSTWMRTPEAAYSPYDATANILAAYSIFTRDGYSWREWSCRP